MRRLFPVPVLLDCGCELIPERTPGKVMTQGGSLVRCPGHNLRHDVEVLTVEVRITYKARRLDPPDPRPELEEVAADA